MILRLFVLLLIGVLVVFAFRFISQLQQINPKAINAPVVSVQTNTYFPLGVFMTASFIGDMTANINDIRAHNMDSVILNNTSSDSAEPVLTVADQMNFNVIAAFDYNLWRTWWDAAVPATIDNARNAIYPLVDRVKNHSSLKGYNLVDEPNLSLKDKVALAIQAFHERDSIHPVMPVLIGEGVVGTIFDYAKPDVMLLDVYPVAFHNAPGDLTLNGYIDVVDYIRKASATRPANKPLWFILQAHCFGDGTADWHLRLPSPEEARMEHWIALGEGGTGIFWFIYDWEQCGVGLKNNPTLYNEVSDLARRTVPLKNTLLNAHRIQDKIVVASTSTPAYASTLVSNDNSKYYIIAANRSVQAQSITLRPYDLTGQLKDLESNQIYDINSPIPFRGGDGKIFEVMNPVAVGPFPTAPELLKNTSFETNDTGSPASPAQWSRLPSSFWWDNTVRRTGTASLKVQGPVANYADQDVTLKPNTRYTMSGWAKTQNVTGQGIALRYTQTNPSISVIDFSGRINGTKDWTEMKISFVTPSTYVNGKVDVLMDLNSGDTAWVDDVSLCEGILPCSSGPIPTPTPTSIPTPTPTTVGDITPPTVAISYPANGAQVSGTIDVTATASDNIGVNKVEFYLDGSLKLTTNTTPYHWNFDTTTVSNGTHTILVKAYDALSNNSSDTVSLNIVNGDTQPPSAPTNLAATAPAYNRVNLSWNSSSDNVGVAGYYIIRNGVTINTSSTNSFIDNATLPATTYTYQTIAFDAAGNNSAPSNIATVTTPAASDIQPPSSPTSLVATVVSSNQVNLYWNPSLDNVGVAGYEVYRNNTKIAAIVTTSFGDTGLTPSTTYTYFVRAYDGAGNFSNPSNLVSMTTPARISTGSITGTVTSVSGTPLRGVYVSLVVNGAKKTYATTSSGVYKITNLPAGTYNVKFSASHYISKTITITVNSGQITTTNVSLIRR